MKLTDEQINEMHEDICRQADKYEGTTTENLDNA